MIMAKRKNRLRKTKTGMSAFQKAAGEARESFQHATGEARESFQKASVLARKRY
jgi:hypothetical protein